MICIALQFAASPQLLRPPTHHPQSSAAFSSPGLRVPACRENQDGHLHPHSQRALTTRWISCLPHTEDLSSASASPVWRDNVVHRGCLQQKLSDAAVRQAAGTLARVPSGDLQLSWCLAQTLSVSQLDPNSTLQTGPVPSGDLQ
jgi:hypothetical protein